MSTYLDHHFQRKRGKGYVREMSVRPISVKKLPRDREVLRLICDRWSFYAWDGYRELSKWKRTVTAASCAAVVEAGVWRGKWVSDQGRSVRVSDHYLVVLCNISGARRSVRDAGTVDEGQQCFRVVLEALQTDRACLVCLVWPAVDVWWLMHWSGRV